jgi:undecaprenyl-diphosphatase
VWRRNLPLVVATISTGTVAWLAAKVVKQIVERGRPADYLPDIVVRDPHVSGLGYLSGHSAMAAALAVLVVAAAPQRWRPAVVAVAVLVGLARIMYGVHFPADVVGGWSLGILVGLGGLALLRWRRPAPATLTA